MDGLNMIPTYLSAQDGGSSVTPAKEINSGPKDMSQNTIKTMYQCPRWQGFSDKTDWYFPTVWHPPIYHRCFGLVP